MRAASWWTCASSPRDTGRHRGGAAGRRHSWGLRGHRPNRAAIGAALATALTIAHGGGRLGVRAPGPPSGTSRGSWPPEVSCSPVGAVPVARRTHGRPQAVPGARAVGARPSVRGGVHPGPADSRSGPVCRGSPRPGCRWPGRARCCTPLRGCPGDPVPAGSAPVAGGIPEWRKRARRPTMPERKAHAPVRGPARRACPCRHREGSRLSSLAGTVITPCIRKLRS